MQLGGFDKFFCTIDFFLQNYSHSWVINTTYRFDDDIHDELLGLSLIHHLYGSDDLEDVNNDLEVDGNDLEDRKENDLERPSIPRLAN